jgi:MFS family permease
MATETPPVSDDGRKLSSGFYTVLVVHTLFLTFTRLPGVFINTMILGQDDSLVGVLLYNGTWYIAGAVFFIIAAKSLYRFGAKSTMIWGIVFYFLFYGVILALGESAARFGVLLGVINGLADGFYWIAYMQLFSNTTESSNRDKALAMIQLFGSGVNLLIPLAGGIIIQSIGGWGGYLTVFAIAFALAFITCLYTSRLPRMPKSDSKTDYKAAVRYTFFKIPLRNALIGQFFKGIREGAFLFILAPILYQLVRSEIMIGFNTFLSGAASIIAFTVMSRLLTPQNRIRYMFWSVVILCVATFGGLFWITPVMIVLYGVVSSFFSGYVENTSYTIFIDVFMSDDATRERMPEMLAMNECWLVGGRMVGLAIIYAVEIFFGASVLWQLSSLLLLTLTQFGAVYFSNKADKAI